MSFYSAQASIASGTAERETSLQQLSAIRFAHPQIRIRTLSADKAYGTADYLQALFTQGIVPLVSLRNLALEEVPTYQRQTKDPERQRKRLAKIQEIQIRNRAKQIQLTGSYRHGKSYALVVSMCLPKAKSHMVWVAHGAADSTACRNRRY